eukprot:CAMPEP_0178402588 /NCGR_PEP_ID=MMETSP0689_2-20121128/16920_1 /TAXON_ID=160604 /ORGANISM="Amphidinium massartii, Strain CS-259" /LENGTH=879 /DNA_ID=CAMNT_0020023495 /DNA_START=41 /DNA_END=2676 /DNA_ORIENTATION=+
MASPFMRATTPTSPSTSAVTPLTRRALQEELAMLAGNTLVPFTKQEMQQELQSGLQQFHAVQFSREELKADLMQFTSAAASKTALEVKQALSELERKLQIFTHPAFQEDIHVVLKKAKGQLNGCSTPATELESPKLTHPPRAGRRPSFAPQLEESTFIDEIREVVREEVQKGASKRVPAGAAPPALPAHKQDLRVTADCDSMQLHDTACSSTTTTIPVPPVVDVSSAWTADETPHTSPQKGHQSPPQRRPGGHAYPTLALQQPLSRREVSGDSHDMVNLVSRFAEGSTDITHSHVHWPMRTAVQVEEELNSPMMAGVKSNRTVQALGRGSSGQSQASLAPQSFLERFRSGFRVYGGSDLMRTESGYASSQAERPLSPVHASPNGSCRDENSYHVEEEVEKRKGPAPLASSIPTPKGSPSTFSNSNGAKSTTSPNGHTNGKKISQSAGSASRNLSVLSRIQQKRQQSTSNTDMAIHRMLELEEQTSLKANVEKFIRSAYFDYITLMMICLNAVTIGWQTDYLAREQTDVVPDWARGIEVLFCVLFVIELLLKIYCYRMNFFRQDIRWNMFDTLVVLLQVVEEVLNLVASSVPLNLSFLRIIRILRLIRVIRLIRILRLISELRTLVTSLAGSLKAFGWTMLLIFMLIYTVAIFFTQLVTDHRLGLDGGDHVAYASHLPRYFGSLGDTILALYQAILGGVSWREITTPLMGEIHTMLGFVFSVYITFCVLAMMNVVTGVFVDSALNSAKHDKEVYMMNSVRAMFLRMKMDLSGDMNWDEFKTLLSSAEMMEYFKAIDVDISEAQSIFELLDVDNSGTLTAEEFITGCLRLQGTAKALDLTVLMTQVRDLGTFMLTILEDMDQRLGGTCHADPSDIMRSATS